MSWAGAASHLAEGGVTRFGNVGVRQHADVEVRVAAQLLVVDYPPPADRRQRGQMAEPRVAQIDRRATKVRRHPRRIDRCGQQGCG